MKKSIFPIRFIIITFVLILLFFTTTSLVLKSEKIQNKLIAFAITENISNLENKSSNLNNSKTSEIYSEKTYAFYYFTINIILVLILFIILTILMPRIKKYT